MRIIIVRLNSRYLRLSQDLNDNTPIFLNSSYSVTINETSPVCMEVVGVYARDWDASESVEYSIISGNDQEKFLIDKSTGRVSLQRKLDYDPPNEERHFEIVVR